eukprot:m.149641 g.149641  ORF g.149641 m.149641 type:complete len:941 (+) comp10134_c0_seq3:100-2922(+)
MLQDDPLEDPQRDKDSSSSQSQSGSAGISASLNDSLSLSVSGYEASAARSASPSHSPSATPSTALSSQQQPLVLNDQQRLAAEAPSGAVLVLAGPGSGKTRVIAARVAHLVTSCGVRPSEILLVTFTNKAAREMESRVAAVLGEDLAAPISIATFHSTAFRLLRAHGAEIGLPRVSIFDPSDADDFFRELGARLGGPLATVKPSLLISSISKLKSSGTPMEVIERAAREGVEPQLGGKSLALPINLVLQAYREYERHLTQSHLIDFDDVLLFAVKLLKKCPQIARQFCHVLVDEFQDTNATQFLLAQLLAWSGNITIVGDPDQSIYGWRNADRTAFRNFRRRFPDATEVKLEQNYRSTQQILRLGSTMMRQDSTRDEMVLWTNNPAGPPVLFRTFATPVEEALMIAKSIVTYCRAFRGLVTLDDFAILIRAGYLTRELEQALVRTEMPFRMVGARRFFDRMEVRDLLAYLRLAANMFDFRAFMRAVDVPKRQVSDKLLQAIHAVASEQECSPIQVILDHADPQEQTVVSSLLNVRIINFARLIVDLHERSLEQGPSQCAVKHLLQQIVDATGYDRYLKREDPVSYESRRENIGELISLTETFDQDYSASQGQTRLESFLESVMLSDAASSTQSSQEGITISTIHAAKGLEWPFIFVAGVEDGIIPHSTAAEADILREERRLLYVAITRAMFAAQLSCANTRQVFGTQKSNQPSCFLSQYELERHGERDLLGRKQLDLAELEALRPSLAQILHRKPHAITAELEQTIDRASHKIAELERDLERREFPDDDEFERATALWGIDLSQASATAPPKRSMSAFVTASRSENCKVELRKYHSLPSQSSQPTAQSVHYRRPASATLSEREEAKRQPTQARRTASATLDFLSGLQPPPAAPATPPVLVKAATAPPMPLIDRSKKRRLGANRRRTTMPLPRRASPTTSL